MYNSKSPAIFRLLIPIGTFHGHLFPDHWSGAKLWVRGWTKSEIEFQAKQMIHTGLIVLFYISHS